MLAFVVHISYAQEKTVSGVISDTDGPLPTVNVINKNTKAGVTTDFDGNYSIKASTGDVLMFSYVGYTSVEKTVGASNTINATLAIDEKEAINVTIKTLGRDVQPRTSTFAVQTVGGEEFTKAREANVANALSGKISGVQVTSSSGGVGSSSRVVLRGASSITGDSQPLYVIDGVPLDNRNRGNAGSSGGVDAPTGVSDINPDDIESISVLKGPAAAALYGVRASNGVIVIKTRTGKQNQRLGIDFNTSITFENPLVLPDFQNSYGQGGNPDYFEFIDGANGSGAVDESWGPPLDIGLNFVQWESFINGNNGQALPWVSQPDNIKDFYETGRTVNNSISFTGGSDKGSYRFSIGNMDQEGMIPTTDFRRITVGTNASREFGKFNSNVTVNYTKSKSDNLPVVGYNAENPVQQMIWSGRNVDFSKLKDWRNLPLATAGVAVGTPLNWNTQFQNNPYWVLDNNKNTWDRDRVVGNVGLTYNFTEDFSVTGNVGMDHYSQLQTANQAVGTDNGPGSYSENVRRYTEINSSVLGNYNKDLSEKVNLEVSLGANAMKRNSKVNIIAIGGLEIPGLYNVENIASGLVTTAIANTFEEKINSLYGVAKIGYNDNLFLEFTGRNDWLSVLPTSNNNFFYPSVTASAVISDIVGWDSTFLKIRGGWAEVGGAGDLGPYDLIPTYALSNNLGVTLANNSATLYDANIKPETTFGYEFGLDARFFADRLRVNATYYDQTSEDQIIRSTISSTSGFTGAIRNIGEMTNKGFEVQVGADIIDTEDWNVSVDVNWATNKNEVVDLGAGDDNALILGGQWGMQLEAREGESLGVITGTTFARDDNGNVIYNNGLPTIDSERKVLGDINPDWTGGLNLAVSYKNISFSGLIDAKIGGDLHTMSYSWGRFAGVFEETAIGRETGIIGNGVMNIGTAENPNYVTNNISVGAEAFNKAAYSNDVVETAVFDASYVKLRQLQLGYSLPKKFLKNTALNDVSFALVGRNLAILYKKIPHIDPESAFSDQTGEQGQEFGQLPSSRSIGFNINVKF